VSLTNSTDKDPGRSLATPFPEWISIALPACVRDFAGLAAPTMLLRRPRWIAVVGLDRGSARPAGTDPDEVESHFALLENYDQPGEPMIKFRANLLT